MLKSIAISSLFVFLFKYLKTTEILFKKIKVLVFKKVVLRKLSTKS